LWFADYAHGEARPEGCSTWNNSSIVGNHRSASPSFKGTITLFTAIETIMEKRLGRGLGSLLSPPKAEEGYHEISLRRIRPNPFQPRKAVDAEDLKLLRDSIASHGVLQPVVVRPRGDDFELIAGERRWRAARLAGLEAVPAVVRDGVSDGEMLELALVENVQRRDLNPIEKADGYRRLMDSLGITQEAVAAKVGLRRSTIANHLRLLELPEEVREAVGKRALSMGHARALLGLPVKEDRISLMQETVAEDLSVREVERRVRAALGRIPQPQDGNGKERIESAAPSAEVPPWAKEIEDRLRQSLETRVELVHGPGFRGKIQIEYFDRDQLDRLIQRLAPAPTV